MCVAAHSSRKVKAVLGAQATSFVESEIREFTINIIIVSDINTTKTQTKMRNH